MRFSSVLSNQKVPFAGPAALNPMTTPPLPEQIELHRDRMWRRDEDLRIESAVEAERFFEDVGFANTLTDAGRAGPSCLLRRVEGTGQGAMATPGVELPLRAAQSSSSAATIGATDATVWTVLWVDPWRYSLPFCQ